MPGWPTLCLAALAMALEIRDGLGAPLAFIALAVAMCAALSDVVRFRIDREMGPIGPALVLLAFGLAPLLHRSLSEHATAFGAEMPWPVRLLPLVTAFVALAVIAAKVRPWVLVAVASVAFASLGLAAIHAVPIPHIDVWWSQNAGIDAFLQGANPYATSFPDLYNDPSGYALGIVRNGVVHLGYPYPPVTLLLDAPFRAWFGDIRFGHVLATLITAFLIAGRRPTLATALPAAMFLMIPRQAFAIESAWMDPWVACLGVAALRSIPLGILPFGILTGLFMASKPSMLAIAPAFLLVGLGWRKICQSAIVAGVAAACMVLPFRGANPTAFDQSTWRVVSAMPTHPLSLSLPGWLIAHRGIDIGALPGFLAPWVVFFIAIWKRLRGQLGTSIVIATGLLTFFALNKFAWCNYYLTVAAFIAFSMACRNESRPSRISA